MVTKPKSALSVVERSNANDAAQDSAPAPEPKPEDEETHAAAYDAVERALAEVGMGRRSMVLRADLQRQRLQQSEREVLGLIDALDAKVALLQRAFDAAKRSIEIERGDLMEELNVLQRGLVGSTVPAEESNDA